MSKDRTLELNKILNEGKSKAQMEDESDFQAMNDSVFDIQKKIMGHLAVTKRMQRKGLKMAKLMKQLELADKALDKVREELQPLRSGT